MRSKLAHARARLSTRAEEANPKTGQALCIYARTYLKHINLYALGISEAWSLVPGPFWPCNASRQAAELFHALASYLCMTKMRLRSIKPCTA